jgi:hypothetical protein
VVAEASCPVICHSGHCRKRQRSVSVSHVEKCPDRGERITGQGRPRPPPYQPEVTAVVTCKRTPPLRCIAARTPEPTGNIGELGCQSGQIDGMHQPCPVPLGRWSRPCVISAGGYPGRTGARLRPFVLQSSDEMRERTARLRRPILPPDFAAK